MPISINLDVFLLKSPSGKSSFSPESDIVGTLHSRENWPRLMHIGIMPRSWTHEGNAVFESGHKAPPTADFLPVMGKTRFVTAAEWFRLSLLARRFHLCTASRCTVSAEN